MQSSRHLLLISSLCFVLFSSVHANSNTTSSVEPFTLDQVADRFPAEGFEDRIEYWKLIFAKYTAQEIVFHDIDDLRLIYDVERFREAIRDNPAEARRQREKVKQIRTRLTRLMEEIGRHGPDSPALLDDHRKIVDVLREAGYEVTASLLNRLKSNIRAQRGIKERFEAGLVRSGKYMDRIKDTFRRYGLPEELAYLPHVESSFDYNAYSHAGAAGIWQFTRGTGRAYLSVGNLIDERLDPIRATDAAARLLRDNFETLGNWPLAITAYNHGRYGILRGKRQHGSDLRDLIKHYQSRSFGFASKNFYAEFLAALEVAKNYRDYFGPINIADPLEFDTIHLDKAYNSSYITSIPDITTGVLIAYNPHLSRYFRTARTLPSGLEVRVPVGAGNKVMAVLRDAEPSSEGLMVASDGSTRYRIEPGDSLGLLSSRFGVSVGELQRLNGLSNPHRIYPGQMILISNGGGTPGRSAPNTTASAVSPPSAPGVQEVHYTVQPGDSLVLIARRFETTVQAIQQANNLNNPNLLRPGQTLVVQGSGTAAAGPVEYTVQRGDTLAQIAQRYQTTPRAIQQANNLRNPNLLRPGQTLKINGSAVSTPKEYTVQRGDTLGLIARKFGTSIEQIKSANDISNANRIRQGQQLLIP